MRGLFIFIFLFVNTELIFAQQDLVWHIGACTYIDFKSGSINVISSPDSIDGFIGSNSSICNKDSQLIFFTNGTIVYRGDGSIMPNGDTLISTHYTTSHYPFGTIFVQGCITINQPGSDSIYYLIHEAVDNDTLARIVNNIYRTTIDITADSGKGSILLKSEPIYISNDTLNSGKLQAVRHANGRDWWLISKRGNSNDLLEWLITSDSVFGPTTIHFTGPSYPSSLYGQARFSENGNYFSIMNWDESIYLFDFDRCTGDFHLIFNKNFNDNSGPGGGIAFSNNNQYLYATTGVFCYQFNLLDTSIWDSKKIVGVYDSLIVNGVPHDFQRMELAPDNKIYISPGSTNYLWSVINNPDLPDTLCDLQQHTLPLFCYNNVAFPNLPNFKLGSVLQSPCDTVNGIKQINSNSLIVFPNPCNGYLKIRVTDNNIVINNLKIYNTLGEVLLSKNVIPEENIITIDLSILQNGIYFINLESSQKIYRASFIKQ